VKHFLVAASLVLAAMPAAARAQAPQVTLETNQGTIVLELYPDKAPATVANFLEYVKSGFFDGTVFHRVIDGFMIQGGGFTADLVKKDTRGPVKNESENGLGNERGTIAMARTQDPHSATAQFFINSADNRNFLDHGKTAQIWGYAVFGKVIQGLEVVDKISKVATGTKNGMQDVPVQPVVIVKATTTS
jgi:cyclophilin family peptidyl-prolyl cis-trans isomerase